MKYRLMEKLLVLSGLMAFLYFLIKILEMKYIDKEAKPLKYVIRDTFYVFISSLVCLYLFLTFNGSIDNMMSVITNDKSLNIKATEVFTGEPGF